MAVKELAPGAAPGTRDALPDDMTGSRDQASFRSSLALESTFSPEYLRYYRVLPLSLENELRVAYNGDLQRDVEEHLAILYGRPLHKEHCELEMLQRAITASFDGTEVKRSARIEDERADDEGGSSIADARDLALQPPVIRLVNTIIRDAVRARASDVHFEAATLGMSVRIRVDGVMHAMQSPTRQMQPAIVSRLKLLADLNIAEQRRPQDGRLRMRLNEAELDIRVSTVPTLHGESVVLRLLRTDTDAATLGSLGTMVPLFGTRRIHSHPWKRRPAEHSRRRLVRTRVEAGPRAAARRPTEDHCALDARTQPRQPARTRPAIAVRAATARGATRPRAPPSAPGVCRALRRRRGSTPREQRGSMPASADRPRRVPRPLPPGATPRPRPRSARIKHEGRRPIRRGRMCQWLGFAILAHP
ncbi:MAG: Flp pilus assembly complex ATPase component TadA [Gemmatimonadaceae bacterium]|nr:Flp pilus assembly complex ATPase component TadA [Gemmatimonadaceae bacterium]